MNQSLEIKTKMGFRDVFRYNLYIAYSTIINRLLVVISLISLGYFVYYMVSGTVPIDERFTRSFTLLIAPFLAFVMLPVKVWKTTAALQGSQLLKEQAVYVFSQDNIILQTSQGEADIKWDQYVKIVETRNDIRFFVDKVQAQIIPKHCLTKEELLALKKIIAEAAKPETIKLKSI